MKKLHPAMLIALLVLAALMSGCAPDLSRRAMLDLQRLPQEPQAYLDPATESQPLLSAEQQQQRALEFLDRHFAPWRSEFPLATTENPFWALDWIGTQVVFTKNLQPLEPRQRELLTRRADRSAYPSISRRAITIKRTDLRALPTASPLFGNPQRAGQGFPFDYLQHGALAAGTPLLVTHQTADGAWIFAETPLLYGWMPVTDLAWVDDEFIHAVTTDRHLVLSHDQVAVIDSDGNFRFAAGIGTILPLLETTAEDYRILVAVADGRRQARLVAGRIPLEQGDVFPLPLTSRNLATVSGRMIGQLYSWGDAFSGRDCSGTIRDLFAVFGVWLPRNSSRQALAGDIIFLADLPPHQREQRLLDEGIPFATLVHLPGHIMLYLGEYQGRAAVLHTIWGVRTRVLFATEGRWIIGKTTITTLEPGMELSGLRMKISPLLDRVGSMIILTPTDE